MQFHPVDVGRYHECIFMRVEGHVAVLRVEGGGHDSICRKLRRGMDET
jgi:hypothetical protein